MRKPAITLAALFLSVVMGHGEANFLTRDELIQRAEVIAIIDLGEIVPPGGEEGPDAKKQGAQGEGRLYKQSAKAQVVELIKGNIDHGFIMYGGESSSLVQTNLMKGRYLAFLRKDGERWVGADLRNSLRRVSDGKIEWFGVEGEPFPMTLQPMTTVLGEVRKVLAEFEKRAEENFVTLPARLRASAANELAVVEALLGASGSLLGIRVDELDPADRKILLSLADKQMEVARAMGEIELELQIQSERQGDAAAKEVLQEMKDARLSAALIESAGIIKANRLYDACEDAQQMSKRLEAWADLLEGKAAEEGEGK